MKQLAIVASLVPVVLLGACSEPKQSAQTTETSNKTSSMPKVVVKPISEADVIDAGLAVGEKAPMTAKLKTAEGETSLAEVVADGPAVLIFTRSVAWCPFCQTQLKSINGIVEDMDKRGYRIFGISYDKPDEQDRFSMNQMLDYKMLSDEPSAVIDEFGLRDPQYTEGRAVGVPYASVYVIGKDGEILAKSVSKDYKKRPTNEQILAIVDSI